MPLYEYECTQCQRHTEKIQKFSDTEITICPHCGGLLQRVISAPAIAFKGSGWYKDLYSSAKPAASPSSNEAAGSDAKPASTDGAGAAAGSNGAAAPAPAPPSSAPAVAAPSAPAKSSA